ncbi:MAG: DUF3150 domain-containing protein [Candidatus Competibacteraceae bacterium]|nr:DUF3150 domain-containing protein [Candidatus Competibacteraceae bacterium]
MHTLTLDHITDQVVFIYLDIRCWSGRKTLQPDDLGLSRAQLPPDELVSLGDKRLLDPNALNVFTSLRSAARRACLEVGIRFLGGFLVPLTHSAELLAQLTQLEQRFNTARDAFLQHFDALVEEWITAHPRWEPLIRSALVPADHVAARLRFAAQVMQLKTPVATAGAHPGLAQAVGGLAETLFREVSQLAADTLENSFLGREQVTRRALRPLQTIHDKLAGLAFLDVRVRPVVRAIEQQLALLPAQGPIQGRDLDALRGFLAIAENPFRLQAHGAQLLASDGTPSRQEGVSLQTPAIGPESAVTRPQPASQTATEHQPTRSASPAPIVAELVDDDCGCFF